MLSIRRHEPYLHLEALTLNTPPSPSPESSSSDVQHANMRRRRRRRRKKGSGVFLEPVKYHLLLRAEEEDSGGGEGGVFRVKASSCMYGSCLRMLSTHIESQETRPRTVYKRDMAHIET